MAAPGMRSHEALVRRLDSLRAEAALAEDRAVRDAVRALDRLSPVERREALLIDDEARHLLPKVRREVLRRSERQTAWRPVFVLALCVMQAMILVLDGLTITHLRGVVDQMTAAGVVPLTAQQHRALAILDAAGYEWVGQIEAGEMRKRLNLPLPSFELQQFIDGAAGKSPESAVVTQAVRNRAVRDVLQVVAEATPDGRARGLEFLANFLSDPGKEGPVAKEVCRKIQNMTTEKGG